MVVALSRNSLTAARVSQTGRAGEIAMLADRTYYALKAEEFDARAQAEERYENIRQAYRKLATEYRRLAEQLSEDAPPLTPGQGRLI